MGCGQILDQDIEMDECRFRPGARRAGLEREALSVRGRLDRHPSRIPLDRGAARSPAQNLASAHGSAQFSTISRIQPMARVVAPPPSKPAPEPPGPPGPEDSDAAGGCPRGGADLDGDGGQQGPAPFAQCVAARWIQAGQVSPGRADAEGKRSHHCSKLACRTLTVSVVTCAWPSPAWAKRLARSPGTGEPRLVGCRQIQLAGGLPEGSQRPAPRPATQDARRDHPAWPGHPAHSRRPATGSAMK